MKRFAILALLSMFLAMPLAANAQCPAIVSQFQSVQTIVPSVQMVVPQIQSFSVVPQVQSFVTVPSFGFNVVPTVGAFPFVGVGLVGSNVAFAGGFNRSFVGGINAGFGGANVAFANRRGNFAVNGANSVRVRQGLFGTNIRAR